jgi:hypothetical protein
MMNMLEDAKKKQAVMAPEEKSSGGSIEDRIFSAVKSGDRQGFKAALRVLVKEIVMDLEMSEPESEEQF